MAFSLAPTLKVVRQALDDDAVQIVINGNSYQGWLDIDIDSDILNPADAFRIDGAIPSSVEDFREGNRCDVYVGLDRQMAGVIDDVDMSGDRNQVRIKISGRDLGAYLADSEAKALKAKKYTIKTLTEALLDPAWGIKNVIVSNEDNRRAGFGKKDKDKPKAKAPRSRSVQPRSTTKVDPGRRVSNVLDAHCRRLGITWWLTAQGDLFLGRPNYDQDAAYHFVCYANGSSEQARGDNNIEQWTVAKASADRFSEIKVVGQGFKDVKKVWQVDVISGGDGPAEGSTTNRVHATATAKDPDLIQRKITRKLTITDSDIHTKEEAQNRADHEMGIRRLKGETIALTVPGFRQKDRLFTVDTLASVKIEEADIDGTYYVTQRRFLENGNRRRTTLTLHPKGVWLA